MNLIKKSLKSEKSDITSKVYLYVLAFITSGTNFLKKLTHRPHFREKNSF